MAKPTPQEIARYNEGVQAFINRVFAEEGKTLEWDDAAQQLADLLVGMKKDPTGTALYFARAEDEDLQRAINNLDARLTYVESVMGGTVVGADPVGGADPGA